MLRRFNGCNENRDCDYDHNHDYRHAHPLTNNHTDDKLLFDELRQVPHFDLSTHSSCCASYLEYCQLGQRVLVAFMPLTYIHPADIQDPTWEEHPLRKAAKSFPATEATAMVSTAAQKKIVWPWSRRKNIYDPPTYLDSLLESPLGALISILHAVLLFLRGPPFQTARNKPKIRVVCISDTHTNTIHVPPGDVLVHAGDLTNEGTVEEIQAQLNWLDSLPHKHKIFICGNHDSYFDPKSRKEQDKKRKLDFKSLHYLENKSVSLKFKGGRKLKFYGAPDIPKCGGSEMAFQYERDNSPWSGRIPLDTDVLITHSPPQFHLDLTLGCASLLKEIWRVKPRLHICGHIHSGHGRQALFWDEGQAAYERLLARQNRGITADILPSAAWLDALRVVWYGVKGVFWQWLMVGQGKSNGSLLVNAALVWQSTSEIGNPVEVVDL